MIKKTLCCFMTALMMFSAMPVHAASYSYIRHQYNPKTLAHTKKKVTIKLPKGTYENSPASILKICGSTMRTWHPAKVTRKGKTITLHTKSVNPSRYLQKGTYSFVKTKDHDLYNQFMRHIPIDVYEWNKKKKKWVRNQAESLRPNSIDCRLELEHTKNNQGKYKIIFSFTGAHHSIAWNGISTKDCIADFPKKETNQFAYQLTVPKGTSRYCIILKETLI